MTSIKIYPCLDPSASNPGFWREIEFAKNRHTPDA